MLYPSHAFVVLRIRYSLMCELSPNTESGSTIILMTTSAQKWEEYTKSRMVFTKVLSKRSYT